MLEKEQLKELAGARKRYEEELNRILDRAGAKGEHITHSFRSVKPLYSPMDIEGTDYLRDISFPGQYPYTRGVFTAGHLARSPHIRQVTGVGTAEETNTRWKFLLSQGADSLSVVGLTGDVDSDDETTEGHLGRGEVRCDTLYDYETLFDGIDLRKISVHLITAGFVNFASYLAIAEKQGIPFRELRGSMSNGLRPSKECLDIIEYCARNVPLFNAGYLDMRNTREAGCTAAQEIAFGIVETMAACDELIKRGLKVDDFLHRITWFVNSGPEFFEEVAKFRALRRLWARIFSERYGAKDPRSLVARMHCQIYAPTYTKQQPFNNLMRGTIYAMAALVGGVQSLHVNSFDEALAIPTEFSASLSVRTQQIINLETGITSVADPLGGSYYVEWLTNDIEKEVEGIIDTIQSMGGAFSATGVDWMRNEIRKAARRWQEEFDRGERLLVGVNIHRDEDDIQMRGLKTLEKYADFEAIFEYDPSVRDKQIARLNKVRRERDNEKLKKAMDRLADAMRAGENLVPPTLEAVKCYMTGGEFSKLEAEVTGRPSRILNRAYFTLD